MGKSETVPLAPPARKSYRPGILRNRTLLDAAAALFVEKGVDATTVDDLVTRAGIAKGTFYHYFESKQALLHALQEDYGRQFDEYVLASVRRRRKSDHRGLVTAWIRAIVAARLRNMQLADVIFGDGRCPVHWTVLGEPFMQWFVALLEEGNRAGEWSVNNPSMAAIMLMHGMLGATDDVMLSGGDPRSATPHIVAFALDLLRPALPQAKRRPAAKARRKP